MSLNSIVNDLIRVNMLNFQVSIVYVLLVLK